MIRGFEFFPFFVAVRVTVLGRPERWTRGSFETMADQPPECFLANTPVNPGRLASGHMVRHHTFAENSSRTSEIHDPIQNRVDQIGTDRFWGPANKTFQATFEASLCYQILLAKKRVW